jgi:hypothetical protein
MRKCEALPDIQIAGLLGELFYRIDTLGFNIPIAFLLGILLWVHTLADRDLGPWKPAGGMGVRTFGFMTLPLVS